MIAYPVRERRCQQLRDIIPVAGRVELLRDKRRWCYDEYLCERKSFCEATLEVPLWARSTRRLRQTVLDAVITLGRAVPETAMAFGISWWLFPQVIGDAALRLPDADLLAPRMLNIDEHRYWSVRFFQDPGTKAWTRYEPWMTSIVDLDIGQVLGIVDGRDHKGFGNWLFVRPLDWRLGVQVVSIDPSAAFRKALRMWPPRTAVSVDLFHVTMLSNEMLTTVRQGLSQQDRGRRGRATDPAWANRMLLLKAYENLSERGHHRLAGVFAADDPTGTLQAAWQVKEQLRTPLQAGSLEDAAAAKAALADLLERAAMPGTTRLYRTICRWWAEIEVLIVTGATTATVESNNRATETRRIPYPL